MSNGKIGRGIDLRGTGGQIVVSPSKSSKGGYAWISAPWDGAPVEAPGWLLALLGRLPAAPQSGASDARGYFPPASPAVLAAAWADLEAHGPAVDGDAGGLHTVQAAAILTHDHALTDEEAWGLLERWNRTCVPPWDLEDLRERLRRGRLYGKAAYGCKRTMDTVERARKLILDWQASGDDDPFNLIKAVRELTFDDRAKRATVAAEVKAATGIGVRDQELPEVVDLEALAQRNERRRAYESGADSDLIDPAAPLDTARRFLAARRDADGYPDILRWQGEFWQTGGAAYEARTDEAIHAELYKFADGKRDVTTGAPVKPDRAMVETVAHALRAVAELRARSAPTWINEAANDAPPGEIIAFPNGLLHVPTLTLQQPSRRLFTLNALGFPFEPNPSAPAGWLTFLDQLWPNDPESRETLQELMGLALTGDTSHQKIFMLIGPKRSGKGTIARVLQSLVGEANHCAPTLNGLGQHFGLESLIGKTLAVISDARLGGRTDLGVVTENLLRISGEDTISVPRKHRGDYTAKLPVRFLVLSNEVPALLDQSGALASRFILLRLARSFFGQEDRGLTARLLTELPGIMHWAFAGLDRLRARGYFRQPSSAMEAVRQLETLGSPIKAFVEERCELTPGAAVECSRLFLEWCAWAREQGRDQAGTHPIFTRNLTSAFPEISVTRPRVQGQQVRTYTGIRFVPVSHAESPSQVIAAQ